MLIRSAYFGLILAACFVSTALVADEGGAVPSQDSIEIDPSGGSITIKAGTTGQGAGTVIRDDVGTEDYYICDGASPPNELRIVVYTLKHADGNYHHVLLEQQAEPGVGGVIHAWVNGVRIGDVNQELCDHNAGNVDSCTGAGMPRELWGKIVGDSFHWQNKATGQWSTRPIKIFLKPKGITGVCG